jgi:hypothetical protein
MSLLADRLKRTSFRGINKTLVRQLAEADCFVPPKALRHSPPRILDQV